MISENVVSFFTKGNEADVFICVNCIDFFGNPFYDVGVESSTKTSVRRNRND